jgi:uncharacterized protein
MNSTNQPESTDVVARDNVPPGGIAILPRFAAFLLSVALCAGFAGCSFLKPAKFTARHFVLTPMPATAPLSTASGSIALGIGQVKLPAYLFNTSLAVRKGTNEIEYLQSAIWAERLDTGFQRVLAANLATALLSDRIYLSAWRKDDVCAEVHVAIEQFDVDANGRGVLVARWRILSAGGETLLKAGSSRLSRQGPPPDAGASGAIATLSELVADLSRQLAQALQETSPINKAAIAPNQPTLAAELISSFVSLYSSVLDADRKSGDGGERF